MSASGQGSSHPFDSNTTQEDSMKRFLAAVTSAVALAASAASASALPTRAPQSERPPIVDIVSTGHEFTMPAEIASGWSTFRYHNRTGGTHFAVIEKLPDGKTVEDSITEVAPVFQDAMDLIHAGDPDAGFNEFANLPAWYAEVVFLGGPGLLGPHDIGETTVHLEPGTYLIECYVKGLDGTFHTTKGMIEGFVVTDEETGAEPPRADMALTLDDNGIHVDGDLKPGRRTVAVHFESQRAYGNLLGHDVHLASLDGTDVDAVNDWMNWVTALTSPTAPTFLGGTHEMPAGHTAYVTVHVTPGEYAWVAEIDDPSSKGFLTTFTVPSTAGSKR